MSDNLADDNLDDLKGYNCEINKIEDIEQSDCNHNCSQSQDLDIKIQIEEVDLTKDEETHNKLEPLTSKATKSLRQTSLVRKPIRH